LLYFDTEVACTIHIHIHVYTVHVTYITYVAAHTREIVSGVVGGLLLIVSIVGFLVYR